MNAEKLVEVVLEAYKAGKSDGIHEGYELHRKAMQEQEEVEEGEYSRGYDDGFAAGEAGEYNRGYQLGYEEGLGEASKEIDALKALLKDMASIRMQWPEELVEQYNKIMD